MKKLPLYLFCIACLGVALWGSGVIPAIIPAAVPTAFKIGNSTKFQIGASGAVPGDCPTYDSNLNLTGPGTGIACGASSGTQGGGVVVYSGTAGLSLSGTAYFPIGGGSAAATAEATVDADIQASTTIAKFGANISVALGGGNSVVFTFMKNTVAQSLTCTISGASATSCGDAVNSFSVVPGDLISIRAVFAGTIVVAPTFVLTAQTGTLATGLINTGNLKFAYYSSSGTTLSAANLSAVNAQTGTYQALATDFSSYKTITVASGTFTITLVASGSQPSDGQYIKIVNYGSGVVTIARSGQNINGGTASLTLPAASATGPASAKVISDGTNYFSDLVNPALHVISFTIDGAGSVIATGDPKIYPTADFACNISRIDISADQSGSITVDVWKAAGAIPTSGNKISASAPLTLASAQLAQNGSRTGWTSAVAVGDVFGFSVATVATVTRVVGQIWCQ